MALILKTEVCGRIVRQLLYPPITRRDRDDIRRDKRKKSSEWRARLNRRTSQQKLEGLMACNFGRGDLYLTLTYRDETLPDSREGCRRTVRRFLGLLRDDKQARTGDRTLHYIYCLEHLHGSRRWHCHILLRAEDAGREDILRAWSRWGAMVDIERLDDGFYTGLSRYLTKEAREEGNPRVGDRTWVPSCGLQRPVVTCQRVPENFSLTAPPGAVIMEEATSTGHFGQFSFRKYLLPRG